MTDNIMYDLEEETQDDGNAGYVNNGNEEKTNDHDGDYDFSNSIDITTFSGLVNSAHNGTELLDQIMKMPKINNDKGRNQTLSRVKKVMADSAVGYLEANHSHKASVSSMKYEQKGTRIILPRYKKNN